MPYNYPQLPCNWVPGPEMIVAAATKHPGGDNADLVIVGLHHAQCIHALYFITGHKTGGQIEQGFLTTKGRFVDRKEAAQIALSTGQIKSLQWPEYGELFSEDLNYPDGPPKR